MQHALGLTGDAALMFAIMVGLGVGGIAALFMALLWPKRWRLSYRVEVIFAALLTALAVFADLNSTATYRAYERQIPGLQPVADAGQSFDRTVTVYTFQWGFLFINADGSASRNALLVKPGEKILFRVLSNDVIHGFNIPGVRIITEVDPGAVRSIWIHAPQRPGKYLIQCVDYCGIGHHQMKAWLVVAEESAGKAHG